MSSYTESVYTDREAEQGVAGPGLGNNVLSWLHGRVHDASSALSRIAADMGPPVIYTPRDAAAEHHQRQQVRTVSRAAVRSGRIASIPWKELVGMKEAVLTQLEGAALVEERLEGSEHARQAEALRKGNMELEKGIAELQRLVDADAVETEAIAAGLRTQISQLRAELKAAADDQQAVEREHESRRRREGLKGEMGLMGEVARKQEAKLQAVRERLRGAQAAAAVQAATMSAEIATAEDAAQQAAAVASPSAAAAAAEGTAAAARLAEEGSRGWRRPSSTGGCRPRCGRRRPSRAGGGCRAASRSSARRPPRADPRPMRRRSCRGLRGSPCRPTCGGSRCGRSPPRTRRRRPCCACAS